MGLYIFMIVKGETDWFMERGAAVGEAPLSMYYSMWNHIGCHIGFMEREQPWGRRLLVCIIVCRIILGVILGVILGL